MCVYLWVVRQFDWALHRKAVRLPDGLSPCQDSAVEKNTMIICHKEAAFFISLGRNSPDWPVEASDHTLNQSHDFSFDFLFFFFSSETKYVLLVHLHASCYMFCLRFDTPIWLSLQLLINVKGCKVMMSRLCVSVWVCVRADMIYCVLEGREEESRALKGLGPRGLVKVHKRSERWVNIKEHPGSEIWTTRAELAYRDCLFW